MPCKVIPFPVPVRTAGKEAILVHHILIEVGTSRYDLEVVVFVTRLQSARLEGGSPVRGRRGAPEAHGRRLGIAGCSPEAAADERTNNLLALCPRQRDESSCATSAQKEVPMTNAENEDATTPKEAVPRASATKAAGSARKARRGKAAAKAQKRLPSQPGKRGHATPTKTRAKSAKPGTTVAVQKPRPQSKGARILELIGGAKGATLAEIMQATRWQAHSIRGFLSTAAKKYRCQIQSLRNDAGQRVYQVKA